ncbi:hypothetical protein QPK32_10225 [Massilia sp. YIM B02763]|uniref:hypothetical protein n=1 Tax=Massilia sp. YIM B02763 TaxID=3050130 RepID=UPI0025B6FFE4|nr:hypothetical protein [Massilia sp. YIM B02763]MDN4053455.1 hypothetical protein [Massilia sp. YIM B02763]
MESSTLPPVGFIPTPSAPYRQHRKAAQLLDQPGRPRLAGAAESARPADAGTGDAPLPYAFGARVLMWKQDPSVSEIGTRKAFLPGVVLAGPRDARIEIVDAANAPVEPNAFGDFVTMPDTPQFDAVHTFAVVRQTLTMYQRALSSAGAAMPLPWQWNSSTDTTPLQVYPYGLPNVMNAFYSRTQGCLKFGDFVPSGESARVYTCRSFDIVAHETGHAVLDGLKPQWLEADNPPQTGGLHEAFGDLTAIFLALSQLDQCEAVVAQTKAHLHDKTFLADIAEQFGLALGSTTGLRNADNDLTLSQAGTEVHALSQVFTGAVYDILADAFAFERHPELEDCAGVLHRTAGWLRGLVLRALVAAPDTAATYADVANEMLRLAAEDGKPQAYQGFIRDRFAEREVLDVAAPDARTPSVPAPAGGGAPARRFAPLVCDAPGARQDRRACCGTMNLAEYYHVERLLDREAQALARWCLEHGRTGPAGVAVAAVASVTSVTVAAAAVGTDEVGPGLKEAG